MRKQTMAPSTSTSNKRGWRSLVDAPWLYETFYELSIFDRKTGSREDKKRERALINELLSDFHKKCISDLDGYQRFTLLCKRSQERWIMEYIVYWYKKQGMVPPQSYEPYPYPEPSLPSPDKRFIYDQKRRSKRLKRDPDLDTVLRNFLEEGDEVMILPKFKEDEVGEKAIIRKIHGDQTVTIERANQSQRALPNRIHVRSILPVKCVAVFSRTGYFD